MRVTSPDGVSIHYRVLGKGKADPALVFVHGWCCDQGYWEPQLAHFARKNKVVAVDLAGHGESGIDRKNWTMAAFGGDVAAVVKQLDLKRVILIGHSMGGPVVVEAALQMPDRVIGIVGVDTFQDLNQKNPFRARPTEGPGSLRDDFVNVTREIVRTMFVAKSDPKLLARIVEDMSSAPPSVGVGAIEAMRNYDLAKAIERVKVPVYSISSDYAPYDFEAAKQHAPSFKLTLMSGVGHFVMIEDPATFNRLLEQIIKALAP